MARLRVCVVAAVCCATLFGASGPANAAAGQCAGLPVTLAGTSGDDRIVGTARRDVIDAGAGIDSIWGLRGTMSSVGATAPTASRAGGAVMSFVAARRGT
jgi:Ca2+-binding RTX toxin-like protein